MNRKSLLELKQLLQDPHIHKQVYDKFPVSKAEKKCPVEKSDMAKLRFNFAKKLVEGQSREKVEYGNKP
jgi:hypothetical protein